MRSFYLYDCLEPAIVIYLNVIKSICSEIQARLNISEDKEDNRRQSKKISLLI